MATALVAFGANDVQQICMLFDDMAQGLAYIDEHLGDRVEVYSKKHFGVEGMWIRPNDELATALEMSTGDEGDALGKVFWTRYYNGCGGAGPFFLADFPTATPILVWDLD